MIFSHCLLKINLNSTFYNQNFNRIWSQNDLVLKKLNGNKFIKNQVIKRTIFYFKKSEFFCLKVQNCSIRTIKMILLLNVLNLSPFLINFF